MALQLPQASRDLLLAHIDTSQEVELMEDALSSVGRSRTALVTRGLIEVRPLHRRATPPRPYVARSYITETGRHVLGELLGMYADSLSRAGFGDIEPAVRDLQLRKRLLPVEVPSIQQAVVAAN